MGWRGAADARGEEADGSSRTTCRPWIIFCGVGLARTPLLTRVCALPRLKDIPRCVRVRSKGEGRGYKNERERGGG